MPGENINYLVTVNDGARYVLKIVDDKNPSRVVELEVSAIEHAISNGFEFKLPRILKNSNSKIESGINIRNKSHYRALLYNYIDSNLLDNHD